MQYISTRDREQQFSASQAIAKGLAEDGGLLTPVYLPKLPRRALEELKDMSYQQRAVYVMKLFLDEFSVKELTDFANAAYGPEKFDTPAVAPVRALDGNTYCLELWHGPTCAFKGHGPSDAAPSAHRLPAQAGGGKDGVHPGGPPPATPGKGALEGFRDVDHTKILVFYPKDGVSAIQELQMVTQEGPMWGVCSVVGNFDDAQTGVKRLFSDEKLREQLARRGYFPVLGQLHQLGPGAAPDRLLYLRLLRPAAGRQAGAGRPGERVCAYGQFRQHPGGLLRPGHGGAHPKADLRLQQQQCAHRFPVHRDL